MGKKQHAARTKGNAKAANSERSAALLTSADGKVPPLTAFFPTLASASTVDVESEPTVDAEFRQVIKKMWKKDATTRLKALQEITELFSSKSEDDVKGILPFWPRNFSKLAVDSERRVREGVFLAHGALCARVGRNLAPFVKSIIPIWLAAFHDVHAPAASAARASFEIAFPPQKHTDVFLFYLRDIFHHFREILFSMTVATVPDASDLDAYEREVKLTAMHSGTLLALAHVVGTLNGVQCHVQDDPDREKQKEIIEKLSPLVGELTADAKFWKLAKHSEVSVVTAFYRLLAALLAANLVTDVEKATKSTLGSLAAQDPSVCLVVWETALQLLKTHPDCWQHINMKKCFLPQLKLALKSRASGNAKAVFPLLLPLYAQIAQREMYRDEILNSLCEGMTQNATPVTSLIELNAAAVAFFECVRYDMVHQSQDRADIENIYKKHLHPLLHLLIIPPKCSSDEASRLRQSGLFAELQSLLLFLERKHHEKAQMNVDHDANEKDQKYSAVESIWKSIHDICAEAIGCDSFQPLSKLLLDLNTAHRRRTDTDDSPKEREKIGVRFAVAGEDGQPGQVAQTARRKTVSNTGENPFQKGSLGIRITQQLLALLLQVVKSKSSVEAMNVFAMLFRLCCCDGDSLKTFEKDVLEGRCLSKEMAALPLLQQKEMAPPALKVILRTAILGESVNEGLPVIDALLKTCPNMLLLVLTEAFEVGDQNVVLFRDYFETAGFRSALEEIICQPENKWEILLTCLQLCGLSDLQLFPASVTESLMNKLTNTVTALTPADTSDSTTGASDLEELLQLCEVAASLFDLSEKAWSLPGISSLVQAIYRASLTWGDLACNGGTTMSAANSKASLKVQAEEAESTEQVARVLRETCAAAFAFCEYESQEDISSLENARRIALECRFALIDDLKDRICSASSTQVRNLVACCLELVDEADSGDLRYLKRLVPTSEELSKFCNENRVGDHAISLCLGRSDGPVILEDGGYLSDTATKVELETWRSLCAILLEVCQARKAVHLIDVKFLLLANLIEPQPQVKPVVTALVENDAGRTAAALAAEIAARPEPYWLFVLDSLLGAVEAIRPNSVWRGFEWPPSATQVFIHYERDEDKVNQLLKDTVAKVLAAGENPIDPDLLCICARCLRRASGTGYEESVVRLLNAIQGLKGRQPALFDVSRPNGFHVSLCRLFIAVLAHCPTTLKQLNWDFILLTTTSMVETFPWASPTTVESGLPSRLWLACGMVLSDTVVQMNRLCGDADEENEVVPHDVRHEWRNFYLSVIGRALIPLIARPPKKLYPIPGILLESLAQIYTYFNPEDVKSHWPKDHGELEFKDILAHICGLLLANSTPVQLAGYALASLILGEVERAHDEDMEDNELDGDGYELSVPIDQTLLECLQDTSIPVLMLTKGRDIDDPLLEAGLQSADRAAISGYILVSSLVLQFCAKARREFRGAYLQYVHDKGHLFRYLRNLFVLLPRQPPAGAFRFSLFSERPTTLVRIICSALLEVCLLAPGRLRSWYGQLNDCKQSQYVERVTLKYVAPVLIERELASVRSGAVRLNNVSLVALPSTREIQATYLVEDVSKRLQISIQMDSCHPLKKIQVLDNCQQVPVSGTKWRQWIYDLTTYLNEGGPIADGLANWKQNLDRRLESNGAECCICFSVLHMTTLRLPTYPCRTCKNKFHKTCLYKWLQQGHATCPLCRTLIA